MNYRTDRIQQLTNWKDTMFFPVGEDGTSYGCCFRVHQQYPGRYFRIGTNDIKVHDFIKKYQREHGLLYGSYDSAEEAFTDAQAIADALKYRPFVESGKA